MCVCFLTGKNNTHLHCIPIWTISFPINLEFNVVSATQLDFFFKNLSDFSIWIWVVQIIIKDTSSLIQFQKAYQCKKKSEGQIWIRRMSAYKELRC